MAKKDGEYIEFNEHELLAKVVDSRAEGFNNAVSEVDFDENRDNRMTTEQINIEKLATLQNTKIQKNKFISELKSGMGEKMKNNPNEIKSFKKKETLMDKLKEFFKKF